ncbi:MAG: guanylate cyclase, partial [Leptospiraceae bacterium]|nr:guanylate cyclase [Leptospiraceae bacterium]
VTFLQDFPFLSNNIVPLFIPLAVIFSVLFTKNFLRTKSNSKRSNFFLNLLIILTIIVAALSFLLPPHLALISALFTAGYWSFTMFGVSLASLINGFRPARIFFLAWSFLIASVFISALNVSGVLEDNFFTLHCMEIGSSIEVILLSLALADRINILKKEKESAQKEILNKQISLSKSFARFVPFEMLEILNKKIITDVELGDAVEKEMTVLFTDIRNYTTISEKFSPEENFKFLNIVLKDLGPIIRSNNGVIDKFIGDAIMALFPGSPSDAIKSAIQITQQIKHINKNLISLNYPSIDIGIGINTGKLILGTVGEKERMEATVISDTVNLASRIEGLTKYYNSKILIGEDTIKSLDENNNFLLRKIDKVKVKGKNNPINLYEILDNDEKSGKIYSSYLKNFEDTIQLFREKKFKKAKMNFQKFLKINPEDKLLSIYLSRCEDYIKKPPLKNWDGTNEMNFK